MSDYYMTMCDLESEEKSGHWLDKYIEEQEENRLIIDSFGDISDTPEIDEYWEDRNPEKNKKTVELLEKRGFVILATGTFKKNDLPVVMVHDKRFKNCRIFYTSIVTPYPKLAGESNSAFSALTMLNDGWKEYKKDGNNDGWGNAYDFEEFKPGFSKKPTSNPPRIMPDDYDEF